MTFPTCPSIAMGSYPPEVSSGSVNYFAVEFAKKHKLNIDLLSPIAIRVHGSASALGVFKQSYPLMICAFRTDTQSLPRETYLSCLSHSREWTSAVQSPHPQNLLLSEYKFKENCLN